MGTEEIRAVVVFASFNPNGFIRERAVKFMKECRNTLPFAVLRQNDWVFEVRGAALECACYRLCKLAAGELVSALDTSSIARENALFYIGTTTQSDFSYRSFNISKMKERTYPAV
ncbi:MAG: hypothetical protein FWG10_06580 [Eubacteriaceae bacterium]|nr:hypothetical protein [Eubacteriaceae bacterium]